MDSLRELEVTTSLKITAESPEKAVSDNKMSYEARKEHSRKIRKAEKAVEEIETEISGLETEIVEIEKLLELPKNASDNKFIMSYQKKQHDLEQKVYEWEILSEELVTIKGVNDN